MQWKLSHIDDYYDDEMDPQQAHFQYISLVSSKMLQAVVELVCHKK